MPASAGSASGGRARPPHPGGSSPTRRRRWRCRAPRRRRCSGRGRSSPPGRSSPGRPAIALRGRPRRPGPGSPCPGRRGRSTRRARSSAISSSRAVVLRFEPPVRGCVGCFHRQGPRDPRRLACLRAIGAGPGPGSRLPGSCRPRSDPRRPTSRRRSGSGPRRRSHWGRARGNPGRAAATAPAATGAMPGTGAEYSAASCPPSPARSGGWRAPRRCAR